MPVSRREPLSVRHWPGGDMAELGERIQRVQPDALKQFAVNAFGKVGVPADDAGIVADHLVVNDLRGVHSHGIMRLPGYVRRIQEGGMRARTEVRTLRESPVSALLDGGNGFGHVVCHRAMTQRSGPNPHEYRVFTAKSMHSKLLEALEKKWVQGLMVLVFVGPGPF